MFESSSLALDPTTATNDEQMMSERSEMSLKIAFAPHSLGLIKGEGNEECPTGFSGLAQLIPAHAH